METEIMFFFEIVICYIVFLNISKIRFNKIEFLSIIFITYVVSVLMLIGMPNLDFVAIAANTVTVLIMICAVYRKKRNMPLSILFSIISIIVFLLSGSMSGIALDFIFTSTRWPRELIIDTWWMYIIGMAFLFPIAYFISLWLGNYISKKLNVFSEKLKMKFSMYIIFGTIITLSLFFANMFLPGIVTDQFTLNILNAVFLVAYFVYLIFAIYTFTSNMLKEIDIKHKEELLENLQAYTNNIENMYTEMRKFKHDHVNMLMGLHIHIEEGNLEGVNNYFMKYISPFAESIPIITSNLEKLKHIRIPELKSLLSLKLMYAQDMGINVHIESEDIIENVAFDLIDLCRVTGILLDNAIEACREIAQGTLKFAAIKKGSETLFIFMNTCQNAPPMSKIFNRGFSTKGAGRGVGLYTLRMIVDKHKNVSIGTSVERGTFIQQLTVV